jgi:hypothetical protein
VNIDRNDIAVVFVDPQNEVLNDKGLAWRFVGESVTENKTVENMERIFKAAKENDMKSSFRHITSFPAIVDGSSTDRWKPMRLRTRCSLAVGD